MEGALRSGVLPELAGKTTHQAVMDEFWGLTGGVTEEFSVDDLLDFSNDFAELEEQNEEDEKKAAEKNEQGMKIGFNSVSENQTANDNKIAGENFGFSVPAEDLDNLEWLSHFVDDSFSGYSLTEKLPENLSEQKVLAVERPCFTTPVQTKARTKRARTGVRVWPVGSPLLADSATSSSSSTSSTTSLSQSVNPLLVYSSPVLNETAESLLGKPAAKKYKKRAAGPFHGGDKQQPRRCSHCGVTKTPQWRAGPMGSKTLCNACGVRYKSGRLLPEYRPACSPTFSSELHSNNHRKVLEMRRKKEVEVEAAVGSTQPVPSF